MPRVCCGHAQDLVVATLLIRHPEHTDRATFDEAAWKGRLVDEHECVERVAVVAEGVVYEAVVGRIASRREQHAVESNPPGLVIELVLVAMTLGDLDCDVELHRAPRFRGP